MNTPPEGEYFALSGVEINPEEDIPVREGLILKEDLWSAGKRQQGNPLVVGGRPISEIEAHTLVSTYGIITIKARLIVNMELVQMGNMVEGLYQGMPKIEAVVDSNTKAVDKVLTQLESRQGDEQVQRLLVEIGEKVKKVIQRHPPGEAKALFKEIERQQAANEEVLSVNMERALKTYEVGKKLGLKEGQLQTLVQAALVCDVGSTLLPNDILSTAEVELTSEQREIFEWYPALSNAMLYDPKQEQGGSIAQVAGAHRQTHNEGGFGIYKSPHQIRGENYNLTGFDKFYAELIQITHVYATSLKREQRPLPEVIWKMNQLFERGDFNPDIYKAFYETFDTFLPLGMEVPVEMIVSSPQLFALGSTELTVLERDCLKEISENHIKRERLAQLLWEKGVRGVVAEEQTANAAVFFVGRRGKEGGKEAYHAPKTVLRNTQIIKDLTDQLAFKRRQAAA